jgi:CBS domain containing-hemolysin-like protein
MGNEPLIWTLFTFCLGLSFLLSGMEAGVFALSRLRIRQQMRSGRNSARLLHRYLESPENFLWTILVGNTLANSLILGWLVVILHEALAERVFWFVAVYAVMVFLFYTFFDLLPKMLFRKYPNRLCIFLAPLFRGVHYLLRPLVAVVESISRLLLRWRGGKASTARVFGNREELRLLMQESAQSLTSEERVMINRVLDLQSLTVRQAMKPIRDAVTLPAQAPVSRALEICREKQFTRIPVWQEAEGRQRIVGLLSCNDLLFRSGLEPQGLVAELIRPALYLDEELRLELAMRRMQKAGQRLAIVLGRERQETGIISLQDILRTIFGEVSL